MCQGLLEILNIPISTMVSEVETSLCRSNKASKCWSWSLDCERSWQQVQLLHTIVYFAGDGAFAGWIAVLVAPLPVHAADNACTLHHLSQNVGAHVTSLTTQRRLRLAHCLAWDTQTQRHTLIYISEMTSRNLCSRYDRHFVGITRHNVWS